MSLWSQTPTIEYCEKAGAGLVARPFYAITNSAYFFIGYRILRKSKDTLAILFALTSILVGILSFIYDAQPNRLTQIFDLSGMFIIIFVLLSINLSRILKTSLKKSSTIIAFVPVIATYGTYLLGGLSGNIIFGALVVIYIGLELYLKNNFKLANWYKAFALFALGFGIWLLDFAKMYCMPGNYLNGRGIFHILTAISIYLLYDYYASNQKEFGLQ